MNKCKVLRKEENGEGLVIEEIKLYQGIVKFAKHVYDKYGTLAKIYKDLNKIIQRFYEDKVMGKITEGWGENK